MSQRELLEDLAKQIGCSFISDLRKMDKAMVYREASKISPESYRLEDWTEAISYLGQPVHQSLPDIQNQRQAKKRLLQSLEGQANRGSAEIVAMILILPLLLLPLFSTVAQWLNLNQYDILREAANKAILKMEIEGGLTPGGEAQVYEALAEKKIDADDVHLDYTVYPVAYGQPVKIKISCNYQAVTYSLGLGGLTKNVEDKIMVYGPVESVSKRYQ